MIVYSKGMETASVNEGATMFELVSTEEEKKTALYMLIWDLRNHPVTMTIWLEREKIVDTIPLEVYTDIAPPRRIELNIEIPVGETLLAKATPKSAGAHGTIEGALFYTIAK